MLLVLLLILLYSLHINNERQCRSLEGSGTRCRHVPPAGIAAVAAIVAAIGAAVLGAASGGACRASGINNIIISHTVVN